MILVIDNYDSFVYNLVQRIGELGHEIKVVRNDKITVDVVDELSPSHIIISPGPCTPKEAGNSNVVIKEFAGKIPILGVCLGHQCIADVFGGKIVRNEPVHGKEDRIFHDSNGFYSGLEQGFVGGRYHSLIVEKESLPDCFEVSAWNKDGVVMGIRHKEFKLEGVQFHPESIMTDAGYEVLKRFLENQDEDIC